MQTQFNFLGTECANSHCYLQEGKPQQVTLANVHETHKAHVRTINWEIFIVKKFLAIIFRGEN